MHILSFLALFLSTLATAQVTTSKFTNTWLATYVVGSSYQISWTVGNERPVSLAISNSTWSQDLVSYLPPQTITAFNWTVPYSLSYIITYALSLAQNGPGSDVSPPFSIVGPSASQTTPQLQPTSQNATIAMNGTRVALTPGCTWTGAVVVTSTYWDTTCGCMKTAIAPAPTSMPGAVIYTSPLMTGNLVPTRSLYSVSPHGGAARSVILSGKIGFLEVGFGLAMAAFIVA